MKDLYVITYRVREGFQAGHDLLELRRVPPDAETGAVVVAHYACVDGTGGFVVHDVREQPRHTPRSNCAPAYYQGRPASLWINVMKPRRRTAAGHLARALTGGWNERYPRTAAALPTPESRPCVSRQRRATQNPE
jgi:hypothetical protein